MKISIHNKLDETRRAAEVARKFYEPHGIDGDALSSVELILEELLSNIIFYAFPDRKKHEIDIEMKITTAGKMIIMISDDGIEFDPSQAPVPDTGASISERKIGGLGIHISRSLSEKMEYLRKDSRNILKVTLQKVYQIE